MPRSLILRAADVLTDHPARTTVAIQRTVFLVLIDCTLIGIRCGRKWWPRA